MKLFTQRFLLFFLFTVAALSARAAAHFTADYTSGCAPLVVHFTNTSGASGSATYDWDLGNGTTSHFTDASGSYTDPGTYTVTLTVHDGGVTTTYTMTITVYPPPTVHFAADDTTVCPGALVHFSNTTVAGVSGPVTYTWAFGDGAYSTLATPSHAYTSPGTYNVTLTATNAQGCVGTLTIPTYIHVMDPPVPSFTSSGTFYCHVPANVNFTSTSTGTGPFTYSWSFGDGGTSTLANPSHTYGAAGSYTVKLTVTDANGCTDSLIIPSYIYINLLSARFTGPTSACIGTIVTFTNTSTTHTGAEWYYGDGGHDYSEDGSHTYSAAGTYTVTLIASDGGCTDTITHTITILPGPPAYFRISPLHPCPPPATQTFIDSIPTGATVTWLYGDGYTGSGATATHTYTSPGVYTVCMVSVSTTTGCRDTICKQDTLYDLEFNIVDSNDHGCVPLTVGFHTIAYTNVPYYHLYPFPPGSFVWHFDDGSTSTGATPTHTYTAAGIYHAWVTAVTANGCTVTDTVTIRVGNPPRVTFTATPLHLCYHNNRVTFTTSVVVGPVSWYQWYFGDGTGGIDSTNSVSHVYTLPGVFSVTVIPYYNGCKGDTFVMTNYITIDSPKAIIADSFYCSPGNRVKFYDRSLGDDSHLWIFSDGTTDTASILNHDFPALSTYTATLATYNSRSGCRDTTSVDIDLRKPVPSFVADDTAICKDEWVHFTPSVTGGVATSYYWYVNGSYIGDLWHVDPGTHVLTDTFYTRGLYTIRLIIADQHGCFDTVTKNNYVTVAKPHASFTAVPSAGCWPLNVLFTDASNDVPGVSLVRYEWAYGDGAFSTVTTPSVSHTFYGGGSYLTKEIVTDNLGCRDTVSLPLVTVYRPTATFYTNTHPCLGDSIVFNNTTTGISSSFWKFGDGDTSTLRSPGHRYRSTGSYTDTLVVTDSHGCKDTAIYPAYVVVTKPDASFYMDDSFTICPPLTVHFTNTSTGGVSNYWSLGDGSYSTMTNPTDLYLAVGYDTVKLIVTNSFGCTDTAIGHVSLYGYAGGFTYAPLSGCSPLTVDFHARVVNVPSLIWDFADGTTSSASYIDSTSHVYVLPGKYVPKLILSDNTGCQASSLGIDTIKVDAVRPGFTTVPNPICQAGTVQFQDTSGSYFSTVNEWHWIFDNGDSSSISNPTYTYTAVGTYSVTLTVKDGWGCMGMMVGNVNVYPPAQIHACPDTTVCVGDPATLIGYGGVSYTWADPASVSCPNCNPTTASPLTVTTYTVTGIDEHGCSGWDTVSVFLKDKTISVAKGDTQICQKDIVQIFDSGATKFTWIPATGLSNAHIADPMASPDVTTKYTVIAQLGSCVPDTNYVTIIVHPLPIVDAGPDQTLLEGSQAQLQASGWNIAAYEWNNESTLSCDSCSNPVASMTKTTTYLVTATSSFGCHASDSVTIHLFCDKSQIFMPNSFTPNNDGQNDVFYPRGKGIATIKSFRIYNRWGQMLFERNGIEVNDASNAWDGSYNGSGPRPDVYVYIVEAVCETGAPIFIKGDVTIIR